MPEMLARFACAKGPAVSCRSYLRYLGTLPYAWLCESEGAVSYYAFKIRYICN